MNNETPTNSSAVTVNENVGATGGSSVSKADLDVSYLKDKKIPQLLECLAAEFIVHKPNDPEGYLKNRFHSNSEDSLAKISQGSEKGALFLTKFCPLSAVIKMASTKSALQMNVKEIEMNVAVVGGSLPSTKSNGSFGSGNSLMNNANANGSGVPSSSSPFGRTPCLEHNGLVLLEVGPLARYLCHGTTFLPGPLRPRMKIEVAFDVIVANILPHAATAVNEKYCIPRQSNRPVDIAAIQQAATRFRLALVQLLGSGGAGSSTPFFAESLWVAGREPSIADMALAAGLFSVQDVGGFDVITGLNKIEQWWSAVQAEQWFANGLQDWRNAASALHAR